MLNDVTGGDDVKSGRINVPPEAIRLIVNSYLLPGTSGNIGKLAGALEKDKTTAKDWPVLSRMVGTAQMNARKNGRFMTDFLVYAMTSMSSKSTGSRAVSRRRGKA